MIIFNFTTCLYNLIKLFYSTIHLIVIIFQILSFFSMSSQFGQFCGGFLTIAFLFTVLVLLSLHFMVPDESQELSFNCSY